MKLNHRSEEFRAKHARIIQILQHRESDAVVISSSGALSWLLAGARVHISLAGAPVMRALVHREGVELAMFSNEAERLRSEELNELLEDPLLRIHELPWYRNIDDLDSWAPRGLVSILSEAEVDERLRGARARLLPAEAERYRALSASASAALTDVLHEATPEWSERQLAAALGSRLISTGADPLVLLANGSSRAVHRHPLPTECRLGERAMAVVCARRAGLITNVTRWVRFGQRSTEEERMDRAILEVEADVFDTLRPGDRLEATLNVLKTSYPAHGLSSEEWTRHHQGGAAGYQGRDPRVSPGINDTIQAGQAFAFNPTAYHPGEGFGVKVEDTVMLTDDGQIQVLSEDPRWPSIQVRGRHRPLPLCR